MTTTLSGRPVVEHWFDLICPFCYVARDRNQILREHGIEVIERGLQIHPAIGPGGVDAGPRIGATYDLLAHLAEEAGLPLQWGDRIAYSRPALAAHSWIAARDAEVARRFTTSAFDAYFGNVADIEDRALILDLAERAGADADALAASWPEAERLLLASEARASDLGIRGTPAWVSGGQLVRGLESRDWFEHWAEALTADGAIPA